MDNESTRPNILWITLDHLLYAHHQQLYGLPTMPALNRLRREGHFFNNALSVTPLCQPCRASMLTGVYPHRHGMVQNDGHAGARLDFDPDERLFGHYLREAGYRTAFFGKWHVGVERLAKDYGFEGFTDAGYGHPYWSGEYKAYLQANDLPEAEVEVEAWVGHPGWARRTIRLCDFEQPYESPYFLMEASGKLNELESHEAYFLAHEANRWLDRAAGEKRPFFLRVDMWGPHHPFWVAEPFLNTIDPRSLDPYPSFGSDLEQRPAHHRDWLAYRRKFSSWREWEEFAWFLARGHEHTALVDAAVARILDKLDALGLAESTMVIYTADHGGALASNGHGVDKGWIMTEETLQIPLVMRWPGRIAAGSVSDHFVSNMDLVPTVLDAAGAEMPEPLDGRSLAQLAQAPETTPWPDDIMLEHHGHYATAVFQRVIRHGQLKYVAHLDDIEELYDLTADPYEMNNLAAQPAHQPTIDDMRRRLARWMDKHNDNAPEAKELRNQLGI